MDSSSCYCDPTFLSHNYTLFPPKIEQNPSKTVSQRYGTPNNIGAEIGLGIFVFAYCTDNYNEVFFSYCILILKIVYMMFVSLSIALLVFIWTNHINYWTLLIAIGLILVDFFFLYSKLSIWQYGLPVLLYNIYHVITISYEIKLLASASSFLSMLQNNRTNLSLSYSLSLYRDIYFRKKEKAANNEEKSTNVYIDPQHNSKDHPASSKGHQKDK